MVIRGYDIDIFIILLETVQKFSESYLSFDTRLDYNNSRNYFDMSKLSKKLDYTKDPLGICTYTSTYIYLHLRKKDIQFPAINDKLLLPPCSKVFLQ